MAEESSSPSLETSFLDLDAPAGLEPPTASAEPAPPPDSRTRGMLRDAIQKVMDEIERHENEAKKHLQQARDLRRELQESFAFAQKEGSDRNKPIDIAVETKSVEPTAKTRTRELAADDKPARGAAKRKGSKKEK
jgi:hypothetical protein